MDEHLIPNSIEIGSSVIFQDLQGEGVLLNMQNQNYYSLDDVGATMWQALLRHRSLDATIRHLLTVYDADPATIRQDLERLVMELLSVGLVQAC
jgi:hypothetical protein